MHTHIFIYVYVRESVRVCINNFTIGSLLRDRQTDLASEREGESERENGRERERARQRVRESEGGREKARERELARQR